MLMERDMRTSHLLLLALGLWGLVPELALAQATSPRAFFFIHGRGGNRRGHGAAQLEDEYWSPSGQDTYSLTRYLSGQHLGRDVRIGYCGYDGTRAFFDGEAANACAFQLNQFIAQHNLQHDEVVIVAHSMGNLVARWMLANGNPNSPFYNRGVLGGSDGTDREIRDDSSTWTYSTITVPERGHVSGPVYAWVDIEHSYRGDLEVEVVHTTPSGAQTVVRIWNRQGGSGNDIRQTFAVSGFEGQEAGGTWQLRVRDRDWWDWGDVRHFSVHIDTQERGSSCPTTTHGYHCNFARIADRVAYVISSEGPHLGAEAADAAFGDSDSWYSDAAGALVTWLGVDEANRSAEYMRRRYMEYASAPGSWLQDAGREEILYLVAGTTARSDGGAGYGDDDSLDLAWGGLCNHSHIVNLWTCGTVSGDGLVETQSAHGIFMRGGSGYAPSSGMPGSGWFSWSAGQTMTGPYAWFLDSPINHNMGRYDRISRSIVDHRLGGSSTTGYWGSYVATRSAALPVDPDQL